MMQLLLCCKALPRVLVKGMELVQECSTVANYKVSMIACSEVDTKYM